jgi:transposase-like protein
MARKKGTKHSAAFRAQVALAALKGDRTVPELARQFGIHPNLIYKWKGQLLKNADQVFAETAKAHDEQHDLLLAELYQQIGRLNRELAWRKKKHDALG